MFKSTRFSISKASVAVIAFAGIGCAAPERVTVEPEEPPVVKIEQIPFEDRVPSDQDLALFNGDLALRLGTSRDRALRVFAKPQRSTPLTTLPPTFGDAFSAVGWETDTLSFGAILFKRPTGPEDGASPEQLVLAMYTQEDADDTTVQETVGRYTEEFGEPSHVYPGANIAYWFWIRPARWLMVSKCVDHNGKPSVTVALGAPQAMRELRMATDLAQADQNKAIERLAANGGTKSD